MILRQRTVLGVAAIACMLSVVACSAAPPSDSSRGRSSARGQDDDRSDDANDDGDDSEQPLRSAENQNAPSEEQTQQALQCQKLQKNACVTCCNIAFPSMETAFKQTLGQCLCQNPGECTSVCGSSYCAGKAATQACAQCISGSTVCAPATLTVCEASPACSAYLGCLDSCGR